MAILELERAKAAIAASDVDEARELAAALEARFASLGLIVEVRVEGDHDIAPELQNAPESWSAIEADLADYDAGKTKGFTREDMERALPEGPGI